MKFIAEIPARYGSKRVPNKNLKLLNGRPLITYAIEAAKESKLISEIYVNTESDEIGNIALRMGVNYYKRKPELAEDHISSDEFSYDFLKKTDCDVMVLINPVSPLISGMDIDKAINYYINNEYDTLISIHEERLQTFYQNQPVNINVNEKLKMTQNILPVQICSWAITFWKKKIFTEHFEKKGHAVFSGKLGFYTLSKTKSLKISTEEDFMLAEMLLRNQKKN